jgi:hypothetical protein
MRLQFTACIVLFALAACHSEAGQPAALLPPGSDVSGALAVPKTAGATIDSRRCEQRHNDTLVKIQECITRASLWNRLSRFQLIADENPGPHGHGNRDIGTPGYKASVEYVAKLMRAAGYDVTIQRYKYRNFKVSGTPEFRAESHVYAIERDWFVARLSGSGTLDAPVEPPRGSIAGCLPSDFVGFTRGSVALLERSTCDFDTQVANARAAGASAVIIYNGEPALEASGKPTLEGAAYEARLIDPANIPVIGVATYSVGAYLLHKYRSGRAAEVQIDIRMKRESGTDYNVIADSLFGDAHKVVVVDAHLDSIYGAGMLDNASGSTSILEVALAMAKTRVHNRLRYIWFGGEEVGLLGSHYYTTHLSASELHDIAFDVDVDVTATPNFDILIADPKFAHAVKRFPPRVVPESRIGDADFADFFKTAGAISRPAWFGNDGTDSLSFSFVGVPNSGILTNQDCCKRVWETKLWGGFRGNYEGKVPSFNGGCVDYPNRWCDNLYNNDPFMFELISKSVAFVTYKLANQHFSW